MYCGSKDGCQPTIYSLQKQIATLRDHILDLSSLTNYELCHYLSQRKDRKTCDFTYQGDLWPQPNSRMPIKDRLCAASCETLS